MQSELTERAKTAWNSIADEFNQWDALGLDEQETYVALTAALVDVPAVEPLAWLPADDAPRGVYALIKHRSGQLDLCYKTDNGEPFLETWRYAGTAKRGEQAPWPESYIPVSDLRTSPPLSRDGEDSAEVSRALAFVARWAWRPDPPNAVRKLTDAERLSAIKYHPIIKALAATRSGSASEGGEV